MFHMTLKKIILEPAIAWKLVTCQRITLTNTDMTLMGQHLSPRYGQVILVTGYPVSTAVNWSQRWCPKCVHYQFSCAPRLARKYEIEHWCPVVRADGRCTVTWLPNFLGWVDFLSYGASRARRAAIKGSSVKHSRTTRVLSYKKHSYYERYSECCSYYLQVTASGGSGCTEQFSGTSGTTAMASGVIALTLQAK